MNDTTFTDAANGIISPAIHAIQETIDGATGNVTAAAEVLKEGIEKVLAGLEGVGTPIYLHLGVTVVLWAGNHAVYYFFHRRHYM